MEKGERVFRKRNEGVWKILEGEVEEMKKLKKGEGVDGGSPKRK